MMAHMAVGDSSGEIIMFMFGVEPNCRQDLYNQWRQG